ncbi:MAG: hypothetical protein AAF125_16590, partial [Chloroflexota bacterium]
MGKAKQVRKAEPGSRHASSQKSTNTAISLGFVNEVSPEQYTPAQIMMLQRTIGNHATIQLLRDAGVIQRAP